MEPTVPASLTPTPSVWVLTLRGEHFCKEEPVGGGAGPGAVQGDLGEAGRGHPLEGVRRAALSHYQLS